MNIKTFVIGAGCSLDFGLPTGEEIIETVLHGLSDKSSHMLHNELSGLSIAQYIENSGIFKEQEQPRYTNLCNKIYYSGVTSIDNFLSQYEDDAFETKVIKYILYSEIKKRELRSLEKQYLRSPMARDEKEIFKFKNNYLRLLFKKEFTKGSSEELLNFLGNNEYNFLIFNYDRCVEYFLGKAIKNFYNIDDEKLLKIFEKIKFNHIYGTLHNKELNILEIIKDFEKGSTSDPEISTYAGIKNFNIVMNIKTIRGSIGDLAVFKTIIDESTKIIILGLGYNETNFQIFPYKQEGYLYETKIILTTKGMSDGDLRKVASYLFFRDLIHRTTKEKIFEIILERKDWTAYDLINHHL